MKTTKDDFEKIMEWRDQLEQYKKDNAEKEVEFDRFALDALKETKNLIDCSDMDIIKKMFMYGVISIYREKYEAEIKMLIQHRKEQQ